jgi:FkbM family methyltransferase
VTQPHALRNAILNRLLPFAGLRVAVARLLRPALRWTTGWSDHHRFWTAMQFTVNRPGTRAMAATWFGARLRCDLTDMIAQRIFYSGVWEPDISRLLAARIRPGDRVIDIGANIGYFSLLAASLAGPAGRVDAIEAWPETVAALRDNLRLNDAATIAILDRAVAAQAGTLTLNGGMPGNSGATSQHERPLMTQQATVQAAPLAELVGLPALCQATLIKMDIEGGELPVLRELLGLADRLSPRLTIVVEITPETFTNGGWSLAQAIADFRAAGFDAMQITNDYVFDRHYWHFDPAEPPRLEPVDTAAQQTFDLVLSRGGLG